MISKGRFFDVVFAGKKSGKEKTRVAWGVYEAVDHVVTGWRYNRIVHLPLQYTYSVKFYFFILFGSTL